MTTRPVWLEKTALILLHGETVAVHGGAHGLRDRALLESTLARPRNLFAYRKKASLAELAAAYAYGFVSNHPFVDGNKRAALLALAVFLEMNGRCLTADEAATFRTIMALAAGALSERDIAKWIKENSEPLKAGR